MTAPDDLYVGNWIAVIDEREPEEPTWPFAAYHRQPRIETEFTGEPCRIEAISLPFLLVWMPKIQEADTLDVRRFTVQKLHRTYVRKILSLPTVKGPHEPILVDVDDCPFPAKQPEGDRRRCPVCEGPMSERAVAGDDRGWHLHCPECGFSGLLPPSDS